MSTNELKSIIKNAGKDSHALSGLVYDIHRSLGSWKFVSGAGARTMFLAYAFLRNKPYRVVEPTARDLEVKYGESGKNLAESISTVASHYGEEVVSTQAIRDWMAVPETEQRAAKRAKKREAGRARYEAKCAEFAALRRKVA